MLAMALMLLFSPHYPWYLIWVVALFAVTPSLPVLVYVVAFFYGFTTQWADPGPKMFLLNRCIYGATLLAILVQIGLMQWPLHRRVHPEFRG